MPELLVILACLNSTGCSETSSAYYKIHPEIQEMMKNNEKRVRDYVGPLVAESVAPMAFVIAGGTGHFKIYKNVGLQISKTQDNLLVYSRGF